SIDPDEDLLRQVFCSAVTRREPVGQVVDPPRVVADDLGPRLLVALQTTLNDFSIARCQRKSCSHVSPSRKLLIQTPYPRTSSKPLNEIVTKNVPIPRTTLATIRPCGGSTFCVRIPARHRR